MKKLSIIIPAYNCEKYIKKCLDSIIKEIDNSIELIIINDGSKDSTSLICESYISKNVKLISNTNHGVSYSRNVGIDRALGKYIMFVDADDCLTNGWKNRIFNAIKDSKDIYYFSNTFPKKTTTKEEILNCILGTDKTFKWLSTPWSKIFNRKFLNDNKIRFIEDIINGEDMLFNANAILNSNNFSFINYSIYNYRICNTSVTKSFNEKIFASDMKFQNELINIIKENKLDSHKYSEHCIQNALVIFIRKLSMLKLNEVNNYYYIFEKEPYHTYIHLDNKYENYKNKVIIGLIKKKFYKTAIIIMKLFRKLKSKRKFDYMIEV